MNMNRLVIIVFLFFPQFVFAFQVEPFLQTLEPVGKNSSGAFKVINDSNKPLPLETEFLSVVLDEKGKEVTSPDDSFFIMPPQTLIPANSSQVFRVKYLGSPDIKQSIPYRVIFKQLSLKNDLDKSSVELLFHFNALILVTPEKAKVEPVVDVNKTAKGTEVKITNNGERYYDLAPLSMNVVGTKGEKSLRWYQFSNMTEFQIVMPHRTKTFVLSRSSVNKIGEIISVNFSE